MRYDTPEPWMIGAICQLCDGEIERGQPVLLIDIDWSDRAERAVARIRHITCPPVEETEQ